MTAPSPDDLPIAIERVERARSGADGICFRVTGRRLGTDPAADAEPLLVVAVGGHRHRFPPARDPRTAGGSVGTEWGATFVLPSWAEPTQPGQAALWVGDAVVPVPPAGMPLSSTPAEAIAAPPAVPDPGHARLAEQVLRESLAAPDRGVEVARDQLDGRLSELQDRVAAAEAREAEAVARRAEAERRQHDAELQRDVARRELAEVSAAHQRHVADVSALREQLAAASIAGESAAGDVAALHAELQRLGAELAVARERLEAQAGGLGEAEQLLADVRAMTEQLRGETPD